MLRCPIRPQELRNCQVLLKNKLVEKWVDSFKVYVLRKVFLVVKFDFLVTY